MGFEQKPSRASGLVSGFSPCLIYLIYLSLTPFKSSGLKQGLRNQEQTELKPTECKNSKVDQHLPKGVETDVGAGETA